MDHKIAILIDANGKAAIGVFDATTNAMLKTLSASDLVNKSATEGGKRADDAGKKWRDYGQNVGQVIGAVAAGLAALLGKQIANADAAGKLAEKLGVSTEFISEVGYAAGKSGGNMKVLEAGLFGLSESAAKAADGARKPSAAFRSLGIEVLDAQGKVKSLDVLLPELAAKFAGMEDGPRKMAVANAVLGSSAKDLLPLLNQGASGIADLRKEAVEFGHSISGDTASAAAEFNDNLDALKNLAIAFANQAIKPLLPILNTLAETFLRDATASAEAATDSGVLATAFKAVAVSAAVVRGAVQALVNILAGAWDMLVGSAKTGATLVGQYFEGAFDGLEKLWDGDLDGAAKVVADTAATLKKTAQTGRVEVTAAWGAMTDGITSAAEEASAVISDVLDPAIARIGETSRETQPQAEGLGEGFLGLGEDAEDAAQKLDKLRDAQREHQRALIEQAAALGEMPQHLADYKLALLDAEDALRDQRAAGLDAAAAQKQYGNAVRIAQKAAQDAAVEGVLALTDELEAQEAPVRELVERYKEQIELLGLSSDARQVEIAYLAEVRSRREELLAMSPAERDAELARIRAAVEWGEAEVRAAEKAAQAREDFARSWKQLANGVRDSLVTALIDGGEAGFDSLLSALDNFRRDMASQRFVIPIQTAFSQGMANGGGLSGGFQNVLRGFGNNFGNGTGFRNAGGGMNWGNVGQFAGGAMGVYDAWRNGSGGAGGALSGAASGASAGMVFGPWGAAIGAIVGGLAGLLGGRGDPRFRVADRENDYRTSSRLDDVIGVARDNMEAGSATALGNYIRDFDNTIADLLSDGELARVRDALDNWTIDVSGSAATAENVLGERFEAILSAFDQDVQDYVNAADTLEERTQRLAEALSWDDQIEGALQGMRRDRDLAGMSEGDREAFLVNEQFDALRAEFERMHATEEQLAELESFRAEALARLAGATGAATDADEALAAQRAADLAALLQDWRGFGSDAAVALGELNLSPLQRELAAVQRDIDGAVAAAAALGATEAELAEIRAVGAQQALLATSLAAQELSELLGDLSFEDAIGGMSEFDAQLAQINRQFEGYIAQAIALGASEEQLAQIREYQANAIERATEAANENAAAMDRQAQSAQRLTLTWVEIDEMVAGFHESMQERIARFVRPTVGNWLQDETGLSLSAQPEAPANRAAILAEWSTSRAALLADLREQKARFELELENTPWNATGTIALLIGRIEATTNGINQVTSELDGSLDYINAVFNEQIDDLLGGLRREFGNADPLADINERFDELVDRAQSWGASTEQLAEIEGYRQQALLDAVDTVGDAIDARYQRELDWIRSLADLRDSLLLDDQLTTLTPEQRMAEAQRQYDAGKAAIAAAALTAGTDDDDAARGAFDGLARSLAEEARSFFGSTDAYTAIFGGILADIDALMAASPATAAQQAANAATGTVASAPGSQAGAPTQSVSFDVTPLTTGLTTVNNSVNEQTRQLVERLRSVESKLDAIAVAESQQAAELRRANDQRQVRTY